MQIDRNTPPSEIIRSGVAIHISLLSRQTIRDIAGYDVGKRRDLYAVPMIAKEMARRLMVCLIFKNAVETVGVESIAAVIEEMFLALSDEQAFRFASKNIEEKAVIKHGIRTPRMG